MVMRELPGLWKLDNSPTTEELLNYLSSTEQKFINRSVGLQGDSGIHLNFRQDARVNEIIKKFLTTNVDPRFPSRAHFTRLAELLLMVNICEHDEVYRIIHEESIQEVLDMQDSDALEQKRIERESYITRTRAQIQSHRNNHDNGSLQELGVVVTRMKNREEKGWFKDRLIELIELCS